MKSKLHFGILIFLFVFLGRYIENPVVPNQQILIEFSELQANDSEAQHAIEAIKHKLQIIGVENIEVNRDLSGNLKITYYSKSDVEQIKDVLSDDDLKFAHNSKDDFNGFPKEEKRDDYKLNISEIQKSTHSSDWGFDGTEVVELNHKSDRFNNTDTNTSGAQISVQVTNDLVKVAEKIYASITIELDHHSYKIPEVRAGPLA